MEQENEWLWKQAENKNDNNILASAIWKDTVTLELM